MMTKVSSPFTDGIDADLSAAADVPEGYRACTARESGLFYKPEDLHLSNRKIFRKPTRDESGMRHWEKQAQATQAEIDRTGEAILILGMRGLRQGTPDFKMAFAAWERGDLVLPSLAQALGMPEKNNQAHGGAAHVESAAETTARLKRLRDEARSGVRLEKVPSNFNSRLER